MNRCVAVLRTSTALAVLALAACSGGGGVSSPLPATANASSATSAPAPASTAQPTSATTGFVYDLPYDGSSTNPGYSVLAPGVGAVPGAPIANADVYIGAALVLGTTAPATVPASTTHAVTAANGGFSVPALGPGTYALTIFAHAPHTAVLHQDLVVSASNVIGTYYMTAPSAGESAWVAQQNVDRAAFGALPLALDESVLEAGRYWASFMARNNYFAHCVPASSCEPGDTTAPPASYGPQDASPQSRYAYFHGFSGGGEGENIAAGYATWQSVDQAFMSEQSGCPNDSASGCPFTGATGHFLNIIDTNYAWTGVGIADSNSGVPFYDEEFTLVSSTLPTRAAAHARHSFIPGRRI